MDTLLRKYKLLKGMLIPIVLISMLLLFGTIYADDGGGTEDPVDVPPAETIVQDGEEPAEVVVENSDAPSSADENVLQEEAEDGEVIPADNSEDEILPEEPAEGDVNEENVPETEILNEDNIADEITALPLDDSELASDEVVLVDGEGETLDMASEESLQTISSADPWWMVGPVKYAIIKTGGTCPSDTTAGVTCFESGTPISAALSYMDTNNLVPTDGILHVEPDTYTETVTINGGSGNGYLANLKGLISEGSSSDTTINGNVTISNTLFGFTISGFTILGKLELTTNTGTLTMTDLDVSSTTSTGIYIPVHTGAVNIDRVKSSNNNNYGIYLNNTAGTNPITITNSEFNHNDNGISSDYWGGMRIYSNSTITLNGVSASHNDGNGVSLFAVKGTTVKNSVFNDNFSDPIALNLGFGLYINNTDTTNNILLENVQADGNDNSGIHIISYGKVTLNNVNAYSNSTAAGYDGIFIDNTNGAGTITIKNSSSRESGGKGFHILSNKNVAVDGIVATANDEDGVYIDNCNYQIDHCQGNGTVTISGKLFNQFVGNHEYGLHIISGGAVTLSYFQADNNTYSGVYIENNLDRTSANVTVNLSYVPPVGDFLNSGSGNSQSGMLINSNGNILLDKCVFSGNSGMGARLDNDSVASAKTVTVKNSSFFDNVTEGLLILSKGNITLSDVDAYENSAGMGVEIDNHLGTGKVTITGSGTTQHNYSGNNNYGLYILSSGVVTLKNIYAVGNMAGILISNTYVEGRSVSITNADTSESVSGTGLSINSNGAINLTDVISNGSLVGDGASINNNDAAKAQVVKITRAQFSGNSNSLGLSISSLGTITLNSVQASGNGTNGAWISACNYDGGIAGCKSSGGVTITGTDNEFSNNGTYGLYIFSRSSVTMNNITVDNNGDSGLTIYHSYGNCNGNISLNASSGRTNSFSNNGTYGIYIESLGNITLSRFDAINNENYGCYLSNQSATAARSVSVSYAIINDTQNTGLWIYSTGNVTLTGVQALRSSKHFWEIDDNAGQNVHDRLPFEQAYDEIWWFDGSNAQGVTIDLTSTYFDAYLEFFDEDWHLLDWDDNGGSGNDAQISYTLPADGTYYIRVSSAVAQEYGDYVLSINGSGPGNSYNNYSGIYIDNRYNNGTGSVKINAPKDSYGVDVRDNNYTGITVYSEGILAFSGLTANYNGGYWGAYIRNNGGIGKSVTMKNCSFDNNDGEGIDLGSAGVITWSGGGASGNLEDYGAYLVNVASLSSLPVSVSNAVFDSNYNQGLGIGSLGAITLTNVSANNSQISYGVALNNCQDSGGICQGSGNVTIGGIYGMVNFNDNATYGLLVNSRGNISITNANASNNGVYGMRLYNDYDNATGNVTMKTSSKNTTSDCSDNGNNGLEVSSRGTISLSKINVFNNSSNGIEVYNGDAVSPKNVNLTLIKSGDNNNYGVFVSSVGAITISYMEDFGNIGSGISLNNNTSVLPQKVTVTRTKIDGNTSGNGLYIGSKGDITLNNVVTTNNNYGAWVSNNWGTNSKVTVLGSMGESVFSNNTVHGLQINSHGNVSLSKVIAERNDSDGIYVSTNGILTITDMWLSRNLGDGLFAIADLGASIKNMQSYNNGSAVNGDGLFLSMNMGSLAKILNSAFAGNYGNGIDVAGDPNPVLTGTCYYGNDADNTGDANLLIH